MDDAIAVYKSKNTQESLPNLLQTILSSINDKLIIEINYTNIDNKKSKRALEAVGVTYTHPHWYLSAWCYLREEYRVFRLDRIEHIEITNNKQTKVHPPLESLLGADDAQYLTEVILQTSKEVARYNADRCYFMGLTEEKELPNGMIKQTYMAYSLEPIARWILANADTTSIISPAEEINDIIKQIIKDLNL